MLNERIRALRLAKGLTLQQVGDVFGISRASVSAWESGVAKPDATKLVRLAELLETSLTDLLSAGQNEIQPVDHSTHLSSVPFLRWDLILKSPNSYNPNQKVTVSFSGVPHGAFATRLIAPPDWGWQPGPIPAGAFLIVAPCTSATMGHTYIAAPEGHLLQLATLTADESKMKSLNYTEGNNKIIFDTSKTSIIGKILEWQIGSPL